MKQVSRNTSQANYEGIKHSGDEVFIGSILFSRVEKGQIWFSLQPVHFIG